VIPRDLQRTFGEIYEPVSAASRLKVHPPQLVFWGSVGEVFEPDFDQLVQRSSPVESIPVLPLDRRW
jgi:hypothetical protein